MRAALRATARERVEAGSGRAFHRWHRDRSMQRLSLCGVRSPRAWAPAPAIRAQREGRAPALFAPGEVQVVEAAGAALGIGPERALRLASGDPGWRLAEAIDAEIRLRETLAQRVRELTGSPTRRAAMARIEARIERARAQGTPFPDAGPGDAKERAAVRRALKRGRR